MDDTGARAQFEGCLLGLALGDALAAPYEGGLAARGMWWCLGFTKPRVLRWTDDTQMSVILAEGLARGGDVQQDALAIQWATEARWARGYGPGTLRMLRRVKRGQPWQAARLSVYPNGSWGNGGAMRAAPVGLRFTDRGLRDAASRAACEVTHAHAYAIEGARLVAEAVHQCLHRGASTGPLELGSDVDALASRLAKRVAPGFSDAAPREVAKVLGNRMTAAESCVTAIYAFERFQDSDFEALVTFIPKLKGDTDTIAAMACAMYGAVHGVAALPEDKLARLESADRIRAAAAGLYAATYGGKAPQNPAPPAGP